MCDNRPTSCVTDVVNFIKTESKIRQTINNKTIQNMHDEARMHLKKVLTHLQSAYRSLNRLSCIPTNTRESYTHLKKALLHLDSIPEIVKGSYYMTNGHNVPCKNVVLLDSSDKCSNIQSLYFVNNALCDISSEGTYVPSVVSLDAYNLDKIRQHILRILCANEQKCKYNCGGSKGCGCELTTESDLETDHDPLNVAKDNIKDNFSEYCSERDDELERDSESDYDRDSSDDSESSPDGCEVLTETVSELIAKAIEKVNTENYSNQERKKNKHCKNSSDEQTQSEDCRDKVFVKPAPHTPCTPCTPCKPELPKLGKEKLLKLFNCNLADYLACLNEAIYSVAMECDRHQYESEILKINLV